MSRPFSYSDENFTIIENVLFCHIKIKEKILAYQPIVEIPPAIYDRMLFYTQRFSQVLPIMNSDKYDDVIIGVGVQDGKKYFLFCPDNISLIGSYLVCYYILKDI